MRAACLIFSLLCFSSVLAQEVLNNNAPSLKWQKISTPNFKVVYPVGFELQAQRMANTLEHIRSAESRSLDVNPRKISVILQNQSSFSNGFVSLIPRRSEFYTMPPQNNNFAGTTEWLDLLASHEYRHVVQFAKANTGFNRLLYYMFGPATLAAMSVTAVPQWFWEGDAVVTETAFTSGGRGKVPNFGLVFRTNLLEGRTFNYHKQYLRSYKHNIPDHYVLGYHMVSYLRERTNDPMIWEKITERSWSVPFMPFRFSNSIKKETGLHVTDLFNEMAKDVTAKWEKDLAATELTAFTSVHTRQTGAYTDYSNPQVLNDGSVMVIKRGIGDFTQFRLLKDGKEKRSFIPGVYNDSGILSVAGSSVVWNEFEFHPRWRVQNYSVIKMYDVASKNLKVISHKSRYAGAALSPDETRIVTVESSTSYATSLTVLDTAGRVLKQFPNPENAFYSMARWTDDGKSIVTVKTTKEGRGIVLVNYSSGAETVVLQPSQENVGHPIVSGNYVLYNSPVSGIDNIYALDLRSQRKLQVTSSKYGAYNPALSGDGKTLYYNEQTREGLDVVRIPFDPLSWLTFNESEKPKTFEQLLTEQEGHPDLFDDIPTQQYPSKKYAKLSGIFNPYSWGAYFDSDITQADIGISSQDILSTTVLKAGYLFDINERTGAWRAGISYQNWFPIIDVDFTYGNRSLNEGELRYFKIVGSDTVLTSDDLTINWNEKNLEAGIRLPLITTNSRYHGSFTVSNYVGYTQTEDLTNSITGVGRIITPQIPVYWNRSIIDNGTLTYNHFYLSASRLLKQSRRDINSKWGQAVYLHAYSTPYGGDYAGKQFSFYTLLYFPGFFKHHSLWGYWGYQQTEINLLSRNSGTAPFRDNGNYFFRNQIPLPRGVGIARAKQFYTMSANYTLPVWYPDIAAGPIVNFQRVRANAFLDYGFGKSKFRADRIDQDTYISVGAEVKVDLNILRLLEQFNLGFRYSYGIKPAPVTRFEFLLGVINF